MFIILLFEIVLGCLMGVYGESCDKYCLDNCMEYVCDVINGICLKCLFGWVGYFCDKGNWNILYKILMNL